ncbi:amino acid adenylation domain-containing protein [Microseira sp. BLCC-F43]|uniref:amino acid adenylation domain-containing protein n=1 Tax=Microseira sp. BLCC-F43 TaxID=3153602 RepID=UPI0035B9F3C8
MQKRVIEGFQLSPQQKHLWLLQQASYNQHYRVGCAIYIEGKLKKNIWESALQHVVDRYEIFRTIFCFLDGMTMPLQVINESSKVAFNYRDISHLNSQEQSEKIEEIIEDNRRKYFDFQQSPFGEISLVILSAEKHLLPICLPALYADRVTLKNLAIAISNAYAACLQGEDLSDEPLQYVDIAEWQNELFEGESAAVGTSYWRQQELSGFFNLKLPYENRLEKGNFNPQVYRLNLPGSSGKIKAIAQKYNSSISAIMLTIWQIILWRITGNSDITIGVCYDGRTHEELESALGLFAKYLPLTGHLEANLQFSQTVQQIEASMREASQWQEYFAWAEVMQKHRVKINANNNPVCFDFEQLPFKVSGADVSFSIEESYACLERFKIKLSCISREDGIVADFHYDYNYFKPEDIEELAIQYQTLLENAIEKPEEAIATLQILKPGDLYQLLVEFNQNQKPQTESCIHHLFEAQVAETPDNIAVVAEEEQLTYAELNARANQLARHLQHLGVKPEVLVGICLERSLNLIVALLGILKAGGAYLPLDPELPKQRLGFMLEDARVSVLLTQQKLVAILPDYATQVVQLDTDWDAISQESNENLNSETKPENLAYVIYTSGSTGQPKGVAIEHRQLINYLNGILEKLDLPAGVSFATVSTFAADLGNTAIFPALCTGGSLHIISQERAWDAKAIAEYCRRHPIDCLKIVPSHLAALLTSSYGEQILPRQRLVLGGEAVRWKLIEQIRKYAPNCRILNHYGPTETTVGVLTFEVENILTSDAQTVPIGRPIANAQIYLLDRYGQPVPIGVPGELHIGGASVARGYLNQPELTAEKFKVLDFNLGGTNSDQEDAAGEDAERGRQGRAESFVKPSPRLGVPVSPRPLQEQPNNLKSGRLYKTGDLARYMPDGNIEFLGRIDHQVKIRGFRIELTEIEVVLREHPAIREAVILGREDEAGNKRLVAYIVFNQNTFATTNQLRQFLQEKLPEYMIPSAFVRLKTLPLSPNGKVDIQALPAPDTSRSDEETFVAPRTPVEEVLAKIWAQVLGLKQVGIHDNFFELGGDSIFSMQIVARANQAGVQLTPKQMFEYPTIAQLAANARTTTSPNATVVQAEQDLVTGEVSLTPIQHWFFEQNLPDVHHWNQTIVLEVRQSLDPKLLERVVEHLLQHHDALRLRFVQIESGWQQFLSNADGEEIPFSYVDLSALPETQQKAAMEATASQLQASLNLSQGPLVRVALFNLGDRKPTRLLLTIHHLAVDGVSWRILLEDFEIAYQQLSRGETIKLSPKTTSFKQWSESLHQYALSAQLDREQKYWVSCFCQQETRLPVDLANGINTVASARTVSVNLSVEETRALLRGGIEDASLAALLQVFSRWTGSQMLLVDLEGHGREDVVENVDLSRTVGWFTTIFPVVLKLGESTRKEEVLKAVKEQLRAIPHRGIGYSVLRYLSNAEQLQTLPKAEVRFNYLGQSDQVFQNSSLFQLAPESIGADRSLRGNRSYLLDINAIVVAGRLQFDWTYSEQIHSRDRIENLALEFVAVMRSLILQSHSPDAASYTTTDFPKARLSQTALNLLLTQIKSQPQNIEDIYPLSPAQQGILFHSLYDPKAGMYFVQMSYVLHCNLNVSAFEQAWQQIIDRHAVLRTSFHWENLDRSLQIVYRQVQLPLEQYDWRLITPSEQQQQIEAFLQADREQDFDFSQAPLMRLTLIRLDDNTYQFVWSKHHLILDGWSTALILKEVLDAYTALSQGQDFLSVRCRSYGDYIAWLQQQDLSVAETFWRQLLKGFTAPTMLNGLLQKTNSLTGETPIPQEIWSNSNVGGNLGDEVKGNGKQQIQLSETTTTALYSLARKHQLTLNTLIQGTWALLLSRYSGESDVVFGATVSGRPAELAETESMVGLFINTLPVRVQVDRDQFLIPWLREIQAQQSEARQYEYSPLVEVHRWSDVPRGVPLFETLVIFENYPVDSSLPQYREILGVREIAVVEQTNYPLTLIVEVGSQVSLQILCDRTRFDSATISRMLGHFQTLLEGMMTDLDRRLSQLPLLTESERQQVLVDWNNTKIDYPHLCLHQLFEAQVERTPDSVAVVFEDQQLTYSQLNQKANLLAHHLIKLGVKPNSLVGICVERSLDMVIALLGILKAGSAYVPLDPAYPKSRIAFMLEDAQVSLLVTQSQLVPALPLHNAIAVCLDTDSEQINQNDAHNPNSTVTPDNLAYVIYTSGSTGTPKGVQIPHSALVNFLTAMRQSPGLSEKDILLSVTTLSFDIAALEIFLPLIVGARLAIASRQVATDGTELLKQLQDLGVTVMQATPATWRLLLAAGWQNSPGLKILCGGEAIEPKLANELLLRGEQVWNLYGPTETTIWSVIDRVSPSDSVISIGRPIANTQIYILDPDLKPVPVGVIGELYIGGAGVAKGYLNRPDLTVERFISHPFEVGDSRVYKTGDLARYLPDGRIEYLGRRDFQVKLRGRRIELLEIEAKLNTHPEVGESVVVLREDEPGNKRLVAYIVSKSVNLKSGELRRYLEELLPDYMVPNAFVMLEVLPLTPNGKVDRRSLPTPETSRPELEKLFAPPRTAVEEEIAKIWAEVLNIEQVGIHDNFFDLGGHSLLATQAISRLRAAFNVELPLRQLFESPTVAELAVAIAQNLIEQADDEMLTQMLAELEQLSEQEIHQVNQ